jgi:acid phosphatase type 7
MRRWTLVGGGLILVLVVAGLATFLSTRERGAVVLAAGDIARCEESGDEATAGLLEDLGGTVITLGDHAYPDGSTEDFADCYDPTWGRFKARTKPVPGNHEYEVDPEAAPYFAYFGAAAGEPGKGYYSYDLGGWHVVALNSMCDEAGGCDGGSPQIRWLKSDLAADGEGECTLAYFHHPLFNSGKQGEYERRTEAIWEVLYDHGADVVLSAHDHNYQRFAPQDPAGNADPERGIREFVVGTGGGDRYEIEDPVNNSEAHSDGAYGVLKLNLEPGSYAWEFLPVSGESFTDSGEAGCH